MRNGPTLRKKFKYLLYTSAKPGLSVEEAILHCLLQIYGIKTILQRGPQTNNLLESYNRKINSLVGAKTHVWDFLKLVRSQEANTRRVFLSNSVGQDIHVNTGRKQVALDNIQRIKFLVTSFNTTPPQEYIQMIGHELQRGN